MNRLNLRQRIVGVIGLGVGLWFFGQWATSWGAVGWVGYAPLSNTTFVPPGGLHAWVRLLIWLALTLVWVTLSMIILRSGPNPE